MRTNSSEARVAKSVTCRWWGQHNVPSTADRRGGGPPLSAIILMSLAKCAAGAGPDSDWCRLHWGDVSITADKDIKDVKPGLFSCNKKRTTNAQKLAIEMRFGIESKMFWLMTFLPRCMQFRRGLAMRKLSVCLSVRLSNAWIVTKRKKDLSRFLHHTKEHFV